MYEEQRFRTGELSIFLASGHASEQYRPVACRSTSLRVIIPVRQALKASFGQIIVVWVNTVEDKLVATFGGKLIASICTIHMNLNAVILKMEAVSSTETLE